MPTHLISWLRERFFALLLRLGSARQEVIAAILFLILLFFLGTLGYVLIEGWSWVDGFYMTFITLTTIGFTELNEGLSTAGRFFTVVIAFLGIGAVAFIATRSAQLFISNPRFRERRNARLITRMNDHYIICGYGRVGRRLAQDLERADKPFVVVDMADAETQELHEERIPYVQGDAREEETLMQAGIENAYGLLVTLPEDSANVFVTLTAREINPDLFVVARTNDHRNRGKLLTAGASKVIAPIEVGADRMAQVVVRPNVDRFMERVLQTGALGLQMEEVHVQEDSALAGKSLAESDFRQQFDAIVIAIIDPKDDDSRQAQNGAVDESDMQFNPKATTRIEPGNILVVLGSQDMIERLRREGCS